MSGYEQDLRAGFPSRIFKICKIVRIYQIGAGFTSRIYKIFKIVRIFKSVRIFGMREFAVGAQGALDVQEQGLLNYGGPKLWKRSGSGEPDLQGPEALGRKPEQDQSRLASRGS